MTYQVSDLDNPRDDDQKVERYDTAEKLAQKRSLYRDCAQGVWDLNDQDAHGVFQPLVIAYRHNLYYYM